ncbi:DUF6384 family protein [Pseudomonas vranovensis]|uniref:Uncharacterized protein n=1 Tax=Pseudomonas vranovensis TaxID=321661 RepID=A0A423DS17_9PSED|nr:DUF6384 family protein [Pseudomonas vranovensis]ROL74542.1 hypothetical protein BHU25_10020 [Pseudomonas vranovensis]
MKNVPLSEKLGAMAVVDRLRHQQLHVQEYLDLPRRRDEIANGIRDYYQTHGIAFDDALVEQGVREFFSQRLAFAPPELGGFGKLLTRLLLLRDTPHRPAARRGADLGWLIPVLLGALLLLTFFAFVIAQDIKSKQAAAPETSPVTIITAPAETTHPPAPQAPPRAQQAQPPAMVQTEPPAADQGQDMLRQAEPRQDLRTIELHPF